MISEQSAERSEPTPTIESSAPAMIEVPDWSESQPIGYDGLATRLIETSKDVEPSVKRDLLTNFLTGIDQQIAEGTIVNSEGKPYTAEAIRTQFKKAVELMNNPNAGESPLMRIPRSQGLREAFATLLTTESTAGVFASVLSERVVKSEQTEQQAERVTKDEAKDIGHAALEVAKAPDPIESLPPEVQAEVWQLRRAIGDNAESEAAQDFSQAGKDKKRIYEIKQGLSPAARQFLGYPEK